MLLTICSRQNVFAASAAEDRAFNAAKTLLATKVYNLAETDFAKFVEQRPDSTNKAAAFLYQAEARFFQTNYSGALELLQKHCSEAGILAHEYQFWIAQTFFNQTNYRAAADAFAELEKKFSDSPRQLEATYKHALAESKLGNWPRVIELLQSVDGKFESAAKTQPDSSFAVDGYLLLADALLKQNRFAEAEKTLARTDGRNSSDGGKWRRDYLLCRIQLAAGRPENALQTSTNLFLAAHESSDRKMLAETVLLRGEILEKLKRFPEAIQVYEQNLSEGSSTNVPLDFRRQSFFKVIELDLAQGETTNAIGRLEKFIEQNAGDASVDLAQLTLGELRLKQYVAAISDAKGVAAISTNLFEQALINFNLIITNAPQSQHLGRAYLDRGWCNWLQEKIPAAESDFAEAAKRLPVSEDRAVARFKLADAQFKQKNYVGAVTNYQLLIQNHAGFERVTNSLFEPALFQTVRAGLEVGNFAAAQAAMQKLLDWFPNGSLGNESLLLVGKTFNRSGKSEEARNLFSSFLKAVPDSPLTAELKLAIAETFVQEKNWPIALAEYDGWVTNFANSPLLPQGEFSRALVFEKAGQESNAFNLFTNFVARFPSNHLASLAQNWVADFYWNHEDYRNAEKSYQEIYQNANTPPMIGYQARLMSGRSAYDRSNFKDAANYFTELIKLLDANTNSTTALANEALFALGDTLFQDFLSNTNADVSQAINAFTRITKNSTNALSYLAMGRMGDCYFQWAGMDNAQSEIRYERALECYGTVRDSPMADISSRSLAEIGVGNICVKRAEQTTGVSKQKWMEAALQYYMNVVDQSNLRDGETFDAKWIYEAGIAAAKICESSGQWPQALEIYKLLKKNLPPLESALEKKIAAANLHVNTAKN